MTVLFAPLGTPDPCLRAVEKNESNLPKTTFKQPIEKRLQRCVCVVFFSLHSEFSSTITNKRGHPSPALPVSK